MSKHSIHLRLETLKTWLEQTKKNNKYGKPKPQVDILQEKADYNKRSKRRRS